MDDENRIAVNATLSHSQALIALDFFLADRSVFVLEGVDDV